jgi:uncharacterized repeat protein (TIGR02543 family)
MTANFSPNYYKVSVTGGLAKTNSDQGYYNELWTTYSDKVSVKALEKNGYHFTNWTGTDKFGKPITFTNPSLSQTDFILTDTDVSITANFVKNTHNITYNYAKGPATLSYSDTAQLSASDIYGYTFTHYTASDGVSFTAATNSVTDFKLNTDSDVTITANFVKNTHKITYNYASGPAALSYSDTAQLSASDRYGYTFTHYTASDGVTFTDVYNSITDFTLNTDSDVTITANYEVQKRTVNFYLEPAQLFTSTDTDYNTPISSPTDEPTKTGYTFKYWHLSGTDNEFLFSTPIKTNTDLYAQWQKNSTPPKPTPPKPPSKIKVTKLYAPITKFSVIKNKKVKFKYVVFYDNGTVKPATETIKKYKKIGKKKVTISNGGKKLTLVIKIVKKKLKPSKVKVKFTKYGSYYLAKITYKNYPYYIAPSFKKQKGSKYYKYGLYSKKGTVNVKYWKNTYKVKIK